MKVEDILGRREINAAELARKTDYCANYVQGVVRGRFKPGKRFVKLLDKLSFEDVMKYNPCNDKTQDNESFNDS